MLPASSLSRNISKRHTWLPLTLLPPEQAPDSILPSILAICVDLTIVAILIYRLITELNTPSVHAVVGW